MLHIYCIHNNSICIVNWRKRERKKAFFAKEIAIHSIYRWQRENTRKCMARFHTYIYIYIYTIRCKVHCAHHTFFIILYTLISLSLSSNWAYNLYTRITQKHYPTIVFLWFIKTHSHAQLHLPVMSINHHIFFRVCVCCFQSQLSISMVHQSLYQS